MANIDDNKGGEMSTFLTIKQTADLLQLNYQWVQALCRAGKLPAAKIGRQWRIDRAELLAQMRGGGRGG